MKKVIALLTVLVLCAALAVPAFAANEFTPSVSNKPAPEIVPIVLPDGKNAVAEILDGKEVVDYVEGPCIVFTPIAKADTSELNPEDARALLKDVYQKLNAGEMTIPFADLFGDAVKNKTMVTRDLFDVSFLCEECHAKLAEEGVTMRITFKLGVAADQKVYTTLYKDGQWVSAVECTNNGDGTVTVVAEDFCPVAFSVEVKSDQPVDPPVQTGDEAGEKLYIWAIVAAVSLIAVVALSVVYFKGNKKVN